MEIMKTKVLAGLAFLAFAVGVLAPGLLQEAAAAQGRMPKFEPDPYWPKVLPNNWIFGQVSGLYVDAHDHIWVIHRPGTLDEYDKYGESKKADCCIAAPPVLEFDMAGNVVQAWGGPGEGYEWPDNEHGITVDYKGNVWVTGNSDKDPKDTQILKFTRSGRFLLQIGHHGKTAGSNDTENLNRPASVVVYPKTNEVFVADGYGNRRVIVFDADTGAYKRHWGAYGNKPDDNAPLKRSYEGPGSPQFALVHGIRISNDDLVYVADRKNNRIQVFRIDGTFVKEGYVERKTSASEGTAGDIAFSPDKQQKFFYVPDGPDKKVWIGNREKLEIVGFFGGHGGTGVAEFSHIHSIDTDSKGNVYITQVNAAGRRPLRWNYKGMSSVPRR
jgi:hypothetical protein